MFSAAVEITKSHKKWKLRFAKKLPKISVIRRLFSGKHHIRDMVQRTIQKSLDRIIIRMHMFISFARCAITDVPPDTESIHIYLIGIVRLYYHRIALLSIGFFIFCNFFIGYFVTVPAGPESPCRSGTRPVPVPPGRDPVVTPVPVPIWGST